MMIVSGLFFYLQRLKRFWGRPQLTGCQRSYIRGIRTSLESILAVRRGIIGYVKFNELARLNDHRGRRNAENYNSTKGCAGHCWGLGSISIGGTIANRNLAFDWADGSVVRLHKRRSRCNTSLSRFSTTRTSNENSRFSQVNDKRVSPRTSSGKPPSALFVDCELELRWPPKRVTRKWRIMLPLEPLSKVIRTG